ncbi:MAG: hypothetical protein AAFW65_03985 [Pseudomonadota bacterium]
MVQPAAIYADLTDVCRFAADQAEALKDDASARRWLAISLVIALQGACACALAANGLDEDILETGDETKLAAPGFLLRRVSSASYLADPARLLLPNAALKDLDALIGERNAAIHLVGGQAAPPRAFRVAADALDHLLVSQPAFDLVLFGARPARIKASLSRLRSALKYLPTD